jgi:hypothetical protein
MTKAELGRKWENKSAKLLNSDVQKENNKRNKQIETHKSPNIKIEWRQKQIGT